jgi:hypothetical protein
VRFPPDWQRGVEKTLSRLDRHCRRQFLKEARELIELHESGQAEVEKHAQKTRPELKKRAEQLRVSLRKAQRAAEQLFTESLNRQMEAVAPASPKLSLSDAIEIAQGRTILRDMEVAEEYQKTSKEINDSFRDWVLEKTWAQAGNEPIPPKPEVDKRLTDRNVRALRQLLKTPQMWSAEREMYRFATAGLTFLDNWEASYAKGTTMPGYRASLNRQVFHLWCRYHGESIYNEPVMLTPGTHVIDGKKVEIAPDPADPKSLVHYPTTEKHVIDGRTVYPLDDSERPKTPTLRTDVPPAYCKFVEALNAAAGLKLSISAIVKPKEARKRN